jgi:DinB superfamily
LRPAAIITTIITIRTTLPRQVPIRQKGTGHRADDGGVPAQRPSGRSLVFVDPNLCILQRCRGKVSAMADLDDLRYPVGKFSKPAASTAAARAASIETLRRLPERLRTAVKGLNDAQLDTPYRDGGWTVRQVVHHFADSHANSYIRFKLALTEDSPTIKPYDEAAWARLPDSKMPIEPSLDFVSGLHARLVGVVESMSEADFEKGFHHPERGRMTLANNLALYDWHSRHHLAHITNLRARKGW